MTRITAKITGEKKLLEKFRKYGEEGDKLLDSVVEARARELEAEAKRRAPVNLGTLRNGIITQRQGDKEWDVVSTADYSAYVEFGTGKQVRVPAELADIASQFKGRREGSFEEGLDSIRQWCRNVGIDPKNAYPIFMAILRRGLRPRPFMYPAFLKAKKLFKQDIKDALDILEDKFNKS